MGYSPWNHRVGHDGVTKQKASASPSTHTPHLISPLQNSSRFPPHVTTPTISTLAQATTISCLDSHHNLLTGFLVPFSPLMI